jgi:hypothetical protein
VQDAVATRATSTREAAAARPRFESAMYVNYSEGGMYVNYSEGGMYVNYSEV